MDTPTQSVAPLELSELAQHVHEGKSPRVTVRELLSWFDAKRRRVNQVARVRRGLRECQLETIPDFESAYIDSEVEFRSTKQSATAETIRIGVQANSANVTTDAVGRSSSEAPESSTEHQDPTYRIRRLAAANRVPTSVKRDAPLTEAITLMEMQGFSQLPVMQGSRKVDGIISWKSIASKLAHHCGEKLSPQELKVRDCMLPRANEVRIQDSIFDVIASVIQHEHALVRTEQQEICGIITPTDLAVQFRQLGEVFLLIGEIENHLRRIIDQNIPLDQVQRARDPNDDQREVSSAADLTFGEYIRLLEKPENWERLPWASDRSIFTRELQSIRSIRNDAMHFDPDGIEDEELKRLKKFVGYLRLHSGG